MKYIDAEKLVAKLTKMQFELNATYRKPQSDNIVRAISLEYDDMISLITSLQQDQPEVDLENYLENYFKGWYIDETIGLTKPDGWSCIVDDLKDVARHFYELGRLNARKEE